jgi:AsmA protein
MSKIYKYSAAVLGALLLVILAFALFVRIYLSGDLLAAWIAPPMEKYLRRTVTLADAKVGFRGFHVEGLKISKEGAAAPLLKSENVQLRWKFRELLKGRIVIHTLAFSKPEITLIRQQDGTLNVSDLMSVKTGSNTAGSSPKDVHAGVPLLISLLCMENGRLNFVDQSRQPQLTLEVSDLHSRIEDFSAEAGVPFQIAGQIAKTNTGAFAVNGTYEPRENSVEGKVNLKGIDLAYLSPFLAAPYSKAVQQGDLTMEALVKTEGFDFLFSQGTLNLTNLKVKKGVKLSDTLHMAADFQVAVTPSQETVKINELDLVINGHKAKIQGVLSQYHQRPKLDFTFSSPQFKLDEILTLLPKPLPPPAVIAAGGDERPEENASFSTEGMAKADAVKSSLSLSTETRNQKAEQSNNVKVTRKSSVVPKPTTEATGKQKAPASEPNSTSEDVEKNKTLVLEAQGTVHIDWFHYHKLVASNVDCQLSFRDGKLRLMPLTATVYGGTLGGEVKADTKVTNPPFQSRIYTENILLDEIIKAFWPETGGNWSGNVNLFSRARGVGTDVSAFDSRIDLNINEAEFSGHPLFLKFAELFEAEELQHLRFSQVTARIFTKQGIATIKRLHLVGPVVQAEGTGTANLLDKKVDLQLLLQIRAQYVGKIAPLRDIATKISDGHGFVQLPLKISGTLEEPVYGLDERWLSKTVKKLAAKPTKEQKRKPIPKPSLSPQEQKQLKHELKKLVQ